MVEKKIVSTEEKQPGVLYISKIYKDNLEYKSFVAVKDETNNSEKEVTQELVEEFYAPPKNLKILFAGYNKEYYTRSELPDILRKYILYNNLEKEKNKVILDPVLSEGIFQKAIKIGELVDKKTLSEQYMACLKKILYY